MTKVRRFDLIAAADGRGLLTAVQWPDSLPFAPRRLFIVTQSPAGTERGGHAHRVCHQLLIATAGTVLVEYDDDEGTHRVYLNDTTQALHVPPRVWAKQTYVSEGASMVVLASHAYDPDDYIDGREEAVRLRTQLNGVKAPR